MGFVVFFLAAWLAVITFYSIPKRLSFLENAVVYLAAMAIGINITWVLIEELEYIQVSEDSLQYAAYLIYRSVTQPLIFVIWLNVHYSRRWGQIIPAAACLGVLFGLNGLAFFYQIYTYTTWNFFYDVLLTAAFQTAVYFIYRLAAKWMYREGERV